MNSSYKISNFIFCITTTEESLVVELCDERMHAEEKESELVRM